MPGCACLLSARGEAALREARDLILLGVFGMSAASPALSASSSAGASCGDSQRSEAGIGGDERDAVAIVVVPPDGVIALGADLLNLCA